VLRLIQACGERSLILSIVAHLGLKEWQPHPEAKESPVWVDTVEKGF